MFSRINWQLAIFATVTLAGVYLMQHPVAPGTFGAIPLPSPFWLFVAAALLPFAPSAARLWWSETKALACQCKSLAARVSVPRLKLGSPVLLAVALVLGVVLGVGVARLPWPAIAWPDLIPDVIPDPSPSTELRVVFVRETGAKVTADQDHALNSTQIAAYLNEKCIKDGGHPGWRRFDPDQDVSNEPQPWPELWAAVKPLATPLPCVAVVSGNRIKIHPVVSEADTLALLKKAGG